VIDHPIDIGSLTEVSAGDPEIVAEAYDGSDNGFQNFRLMEQRNAMM
jgi:hypothetical protein